MGFGKDITGYLPPQMKELFKDDAAVKDMLTIIAEIQPALDTARKDPAADAELRENLDAVSNLLSLGKSVVEKKGKVGLGDVGRIMPILSNPGKYRALFENLSVSLQEGEPALIGFAKDLAGNTKLIEAVDRVWPKTLPPEQKELLEDPEIRKELLICLGEMERAVDGVRKDAKTEKSLKEAFNDAASITSVARTYLEKGSFASIPSDTMVELALNIPKLSKVGQTLTEAFEAKNPTIVELQKSMRGNQASVDALKRIVPKTHGKLFLLEEDATGQGYAVELVSGGKMKFPLERVDYEEIKSALEGKPAPKQKPGQGPKV